MTSCIFDTSENAAHAGFLRIAPMKTRSFNADDACTELRRTRGRIKPAAAGAYDADVAFVIPDGGTGRGSIGDASLAGNVAALCSRYVPSEADALPLMLGGTSTSEDPSADQSPITPSSTA